MKKTLLLVFILAFSLNVAKAQTANELLGKWKFVKWTTGRGKEKAVKDSTFQIFKENNLFISVADGKEHKGKWKLSQNNKMLTIRSGIIVVNFRIDYFDAKRRIITADQVGTLEYQKVE